MADVGKVTGQTVEINRDGTTPTRMMQVVISDDTDVQTAQLMNPAGVDSCPAANSLVIVVPVGSAWKIAVAADDGVTPSVNEGEIKIYAQSAGVIVSSVYCKADGSVVVNDGTDWAVQYTALKAAFDQLKSDFDNFVTVTYNLHNHPTAAVGAPSVPSVVGTASTADMTSAKVQTVRLP